ncbi:b127 [miniopterid betaherpesvirus 1]|uniref:B127 n=1 Tax=miniopterid betaherpesvirus 1 TaxID=3070189 RepID=I3VQC4_9BETA|nr:b127 [miniopterid betaherpesvirus 1]AFK83968.1 b127 [miniopterid betaherpesvirus 1]
MKYFRCATAIRTYISSSETKRDPNRHRVKNRFIIFRLVVQPVPRCAEISDINAANIFGATRRLHYTWTAGPAPTPKWVNFNLVVKNLLHYINSTTNPKKTIASSRIANLTCSIGKNSRKNIPWLRLSTSS